MELSGKAAIVTGAATGVGRSTALALARAGCDVVVNYSRSKDVAGTKKAAVDRTLLDAVCTPDDVKDASFGFLLGSRLTTGEILVVDGGYGKAL